ncbi:hypothetical protein WJU23_08760 [Prosthecobacter sp. SYSU 5D2]|uniref:hypothetical protein n=1 Tax=Prosthecobacter sp. SYSU 5D2 TaxID=3134134 RepID=UPI0031FE5B20
MKTRLLITHGTGPLIGVLALSCLAVSAQGQQYSYPPPPGYSQPAAPQYPSQAPAYPQQGYAQPQYETEYVSPMEFLPTFGRKFGDMFRRVFYGDSQPAPGYSPHGYPMPGSGRSLDSAPPAYESHYGQQPRTGIIDPRYQQAPGYPQQQGFAQPGYAQPGVPQYQSPPPQRQAVPPSASQPGSRMGSTPPPRTSVKPAPAPAPKTTQSPPKKYIPPTITKKTSPVVEEMPPPAPSKKETAAAEQTEFYPLPGAKPKTDAAKPSTSSSSSSKPSTGSTAGNNGAFLKGKRASKEGRVISPYPPYQELDVTGLSSGSLALDPTTQKVFEVP